MTRGTAEAPLLGVGQDGVDGPPGLAVVGDAAVSGTEPIIDIAEAMFRLVRTWGNLKAKLVASVDPEMSSLFLVGWLVKEGPTRAKDLAEATCADQSTVSRQVAGLVKAGLIERQADPDDGRASLLVPTALGVAKMEKHFRNRGQALEPLMADWTAADRHQFLRLLSRFTATLESRRDDVAKRIAENHASQLDSFTTAVPHESPQHVPAVNRDVSYQVETVQSHTRTERSN